MSILKDLNKDLAYVLKYYYPYTLKVWKQPGNHIYIRKSDNNHIKKKVSKFSIHFWNKFNLNQNVGIYGTIVFCSKNLRVPFTLYNIIKFVIQN